MKYSKAKRELFRKDASQPFKKLPDGRAPEEFTSWRRNGFAAPQRKTQSRDKAMDDMSAHRDKTVGGGCRYKADGAQTYNPSFKRLTTP